MTENGFSLEFLPDILLYLFMFLVSSFFIFKGLKNKKKSIFSKLLILTGILIPSIFAGIRYGVGVDFFSYLGMYNEAAAGYPIYFRDIEPASTALVTLSAYMGSSVLMFFLFSFLSNFCSYLAFSKIFDKDDKKTTLAYLLYLCIVFPTNLDVIRSGTAIAFVFLAYSYLIKDFSKKNFIKSLALIFIGFLFHFSAALAYIFIPAFFVAKLKKTRKTPRVVTWLIYLFAAIMVPTIFSIIDVFALGGYTRYMIGFGGDFSIPAANIIMNIPILLSIPIILKSNDYDETEHKIFYISLFYIPLTIMVGWLTYAAGLSRISFMMDPIIICLIVTLLSKKTTINFLYKALIIISTITIISLMCIRNLIWSGGLPYQTVFNKEIIYETKS